MKQIRNAHWTGDAAVTAAVLIGVLTMSGIDVAALVTRFIPYAQPFGAEYETRALSSVGDRVPETSDPTKEYQMMGHPLTVSVRTPAHVAR